jgi:hypothetical protein
VLVNLQTHARLGVIHGAHHFPGYSHHGLQVEWAKDSSWCAVTFEERYGFGTITLVEPHGATCTQTDLGTHLQKALDAVIARQSKDGGGGCGSAYFHEAPGRKVLVRATDQTNPKSLEGVHTWCALFQGTFDLKARKWTRSEERKIELDDMIALESAFSDTLDEHVTFSSEADRLKWHDDRLNDVYGGVRLLLPPERFAAVKKAQRAWLKQLEAGGSDTNKCKLMVARIGELREMVWER